MPLSRTKTVVTRSRVCLDTRAPLVHAAHQDHITMSFEGDLPRGAGALLAPGRGAGNATLAARGFRAAGGPEAATAGTTAVDVSSSCSATVSSETVPAGHRAIPTVATVSMTTTVATLQTPTSSDSMPTSTSSVTENVSEMTAMT